MPTLADLNQLSRDGFTAAVGWVFEHSPWIAEQAWATRPWAGVEMLHEAMVSRVEAAPIRAKLELIRAHPDLGARAKMAEASVAEQKGAGLDSLSLEEYAELHRLNEAYKARFGFPFILAVKGKDKHDILASLAERLGNAKEDELETALREIYKIARFRLNDTVTE